MEQSLKKSPVIDQEVPFKSRPVTGTFDCYEMEKLGLADLYIGEELSYQAPFNTPYKNQSQGFSEQETKAAWALIRSKLWRAKRIKSAPISVLTEHEYSLILKSTEEYRHLKGFTMLRFEQQIEEAKDLSFLEKCLNTLQNLHQLWTETKRIFECPYLSLDKHSEPVFSVRSTKENGIAYGCDEFEAALVYEYLYSEGYLRKHGDPFQGLVLSPTGYLQVDHLRRGQNSILKQAFFIRRYDRELDMFLRPIMDEVKHSTGCEIKAVWETHHNERIDDRILRLIRESSLVVVDVASDRFNVGLEVGYALALRKPIVAIREKPQPWMPLPFDISTLNCYDYERSKPEELVYVVSERVMAAIEEAKLFKEIAQARRSP